MNDSAELMIKIKNLATQVDDFIIHNLTGDVKNLWEAAQHYILGGGKRLRPFIALKSTELLGITQSSIIPIIAAIETLHNFTLIHDDIMDHDLFRRNIPSVHSKWGESIAILAGDLLYSKCFTFINQTNIDIQKKFLITQILAEVGVELCEGQAMDINFENSDEISTDEYFQMIKLKTGALFSASGRIGGIIAGCSKEHLDSLNQYGINLGIAFQIVDDILGLVGEEKTFGKPIGSDIHESKKTFLLLYALEHLEMNEKELLGDILAKETKSEKDVQTAISLIQKSQAITVAQNIAKEFSNKAIIALERFSNSQAKSDLEALAQFAVCRSF